MIYLTMILKMKIKILANYIKYLCKIFILIYYIMRRKGIFSSLNTFSTSRRKKHRTRYRKSSQQKRKAHYTRKQFKMRGG